jgi:hypothetical protein
MRSRAGSRGKIKRRPAEDAFPENMGRGEAHKPVFPMEIIRILPATLSWPPMLKRQLKVKQRNE